MVGENAVPLVRTGLLDDTQFGDKPPDDEENEPSEEEHEESLLRARIRRFTKASVDTIWRCVRANSLGF